MGRMTKAKPKPAQDDSRELLLKAGKVLFAKNGFDGTTVRDIAQMAGVNLSMVSYHFDGKEGLYRACINEYGQARLQFALALFEPVQSLEEFRIKLKLILTAMLAAQYEQPELSKIIFREIEAGLPVAKEVFEQTFLKITEALIGFLKHAQKVGILRSNLDPHYLALMLHGSIGHVNRIDATNKRYFQRTIADPKQRERIVENLLILLVDGGAENSAPK
jgi:TetR/AcrR family transcriptional regulator